MRITPLLMERSFLESLAELNERLDAANRQVSSGRRINSPRDDPSGSAESVRLHSEASAVDQYRANSDAGELFAGSADSALDSAFNILTTIFTRGSAAASDTQIPSTRATLAQEVRSLRDQLLSLANTVIKGRYIFAGSRVDAPAFSISGDTVSYQGDQEVNRTLIAEALLFDQNVPGSTVFNSAFAGVESLLAALDADDVAAIRNALPQVSASLSEISGQRARLGAGLAQLERNRTDLDTRGLNIDTRLAHVEDADMAAAVTEFSQIQTALRASLSARALVEQRNLFDFLV